MAIGDVAEALLPPGTRVQHKWPNDLLINGRKASGILLEAQPGFVVLGIGVNIASHPADTPYPATDLVAAGAAPIAPQALLERLLAAFAPLYDSWERGGLRGAAAGLAPPRRRPGRAPSRCGWSARRWPARSSTWSPTATLRLGLSDGTERRIAAGDVYLPADPRAEPCC